MRSYGRGLVVALALSTAGAAAPTAPAKPVPTPEQIIGFRPGSDRKLADFAQITAYFTALAAASPRVQLFSIGKSTEGREMILAAISSEGNLRRLARFKDIARQLASARGLSDDQAHALAREGKAIVWIDFGLHATEVAHAQASTEVAYLVATSETDEMRRIRDDVIFVTVPVMNPDGLDIVANWYRPHVGTPFEASPLPVLYQKYAGHDNNRDWYMQNLAETRVITEQLYHQWYPQVLYNQHQSGQTSPRIWTPPMDDPVNPNMHPLVNRGITLLGVGIQQRLEQEGKTGAEGFSQYSNWWNGGMRSTPCFHNIVSILTEVASGNYASPVEIAPRQLPQMLASGESARQPSTWNPSPWPGGTWTFRDQVDYMISGSMAVLRLGAEYREDWLYNRYQMARDQIALGKKGDPYAYVIPRDQHDWRTAFRLAEILSRGDVEVHRARAKFSAGGKQYRDGSFVILMAQPNRGYAKDLLEPQQHPNRTNGPGGPPKRPYDMAGWTLPYQMGVRADAIEDPFDADLQLMTTYAIVGSPLDTPPGPDRLPISLDRNANDAVAVAAKALSRGSRVWITAKRFFVDGADDRAMGDVVLRLQYQARAPLPAEARLLHPLRVGVYKSYLASMDEGWTRYVLEEFDIPFTSIENKDVRAGNLKSRFDAIVLASQDADAIVNGHAPGTMPPEYVGGIGIDGVAALRAFVEQGGTLVAIDAASTLPIRYFGIPVRDALDGVRNTEFYCPGSLLRMKIETNEPLMAGMPAEQAAFFVNGRAFDLGPARRGFGGEAETATGTPDNVRVLARYAEKADDVLMSGWINGANRIAGKAASVDVRLGLGHVVLAGFGIVFRGQPHGTFKFLFNPILESAAETSRPRRASVDSRQSSVVSR
jgi:zinc carboxypeptidase